MSHNQDQDFSAKLKELEAITTWFESEEVDLNEALAKFERGMHLAEALKRDLQQVENQVEKIKEKFASQPADTDVQSAERAGAADTQHESEGEDDSTSGPSLFA